MRIISGKSRGTKLYTLDGLDTRPTLDRVKESMFNIINNQISEAVVLDLFSGSGAIGLEFASRGAKKVYVCDNSKKAIDIIRKNIEKSIKNIIKITFFKIITYSFSKTTLTKLLKFFWNFKLIVPGGPLRCLAIISSISLVGFDLSSA